MQPGGDALEVLAAYRHCEEITWSQARNFSYGIRLLPPPKRRALSAVYAFARRIDDIGDGDLPADQKLAALERERASVARLAGDAPAGDAATLAGDAVAPGAVAPGAVAPGAAAGDAVAQGAVAPGAVAQGAAAQGADAGQDAVAGDAPAGSRPAGEPPAAGDDGPATDPVLVALADAGRRFPIPLRAFGELIDGCEADVRGTTYTTFEELRHYCRCVAGSIGRLSLGVFGTPDVATAEPLADALGVALQLTNILRDIREDYRSGRVYLPAEDFDRFGTALRPNGSGGPAADPKLVDLVTFEAERARDWYSRGLTLMPMLDRRSAACTGAMAGIYFRLLQDISAAPEAVLQRRVSLSAGQKAMVAARSLAGAALRAGRPSRQPAGTAGAPR
jgi:15-cis-phytoene synthase